MNTDLFHTWKGYHFWPTSNQWKKSVPNHDRILVLKSTILKNLWNPTSSKSMHISSLECLCKPGAQLQTGPMSVSSDGRKKLCRIMTLFLMHIIFIMCSWASVHIHLDHDLHKTFRIWCKSLDCTIVFRRNVLYNISGVLLRLLKYIYYYNLLIKTNIFNAPS